MILGLTQEERNRKGMDISFALGRAIGRGCDVRGCSAPNLSGNLDSPTTMTVEIELEVDTELVQDIRKILWGKE